MEEIEWMDGHVVVDGVRLRYARAGQGSPVLLLHGVTDNGRCWGRTADALAQAHDVILLDQRAHGRSEAPESGYTLADLAEDAAGVIRGLGLAPVAVLGHSLGARVGLALATMYPDLVVRLVLDDPPLDFDWSSPEQPELDADQARYQWFEWLRSLRMLSRHDLVAYCQAQSPAWSPNECARWVESKLEVNPRLWGPGGLEIAGPWRQEMERVMCPVLLVRGDVALGSVVAAAALGSVVDDAHAAEAMQLLPRGSDVHISGAGHSIHRDKFDAFITAVGPFLGHD